jgi:hypothetical protein
VRHDCPAGVQVKRAKHGLPVQSAAVGLWQVMRMGAAMQASVGVDQPCIQELNMKLLKLTPVIMIAGLIASAPVWAQTAEKQKTQDGNGPAMVGPGSAAYKQKTDGAGPPMVGPASGAYKQNTQSMAHEAAPSEVAKQN